MADVVTVDVRFRDQFGNEEVFTDFNVGVPDVITAGLNLIWIELQRRGIYTIRLEDMRNVTLFGTPFQIPQNDRMEAHLNKWIQILVNGINIDIAIKFKYRTNTP